jgi:hypothetical protein
VNWFYAHYEWVIGVVLVPIAVIFIKQWLGSSPKTEDKTVAQLQQENVELRKALDASEGKLRLRDSIEKRGTLFYKHSESDPICPVCWQRDERIVYLPPSYQWSGGIRRDCQVCHETSWEVPMRR